MLNKANIGEDATRIDPLQQIIKDFQIEDSLAQAMSRWSVTLFERDCTENYFKSMRDFGGYYDMSRIDRYFAPLNQIYGTVGRLQVERIIAKQERREIKQSEMERAKEGFSVAAGLIGVNVEEFESDEKDTNVLYVASLKRIDQQYMITLAVNVPTIVRVIEEIEKRSSPK